MRKLTILFLLLVCVSGLFACSFAAGEKPYKNLTTAEVSSATVQLTPPDKKIQIEDIGELVELLKSVMIYDVDNSYTEYDGQSVVFTLMMADGSQTNIMAYNPFLVIDGTGYQTEYEPCEALNEYANRLLNAENSTVILEEPPALTVISDETAVGALLGSYAWQIRNGDGTSTAMNADSAHPLDCKDVLLPLETTEKTAALNFSETPDSILNVQCWSDAHWSDPAAKSEAVAVRGNTIELKSGGYIYEITAQWDAENGYGGTAHYMVYIKSDSYEE